MTANFQIRVFGHGTENFLKSTLFIVNCSDSLSAEFVGHASTPYNKIGRHLYLIKANKTSSDALRVLRPIFPKRLAIKSHVDV